MDSWRTQEGCPEGSRRNEWWLFGLGRFSEKIGRQAKWHLNIAITHTGWEHKFQVDHKRHANSGSFHVAQCERERDHAVLLP